MGKIKVLELIERLKDIYGSYPEFSGGCIKFHLLLKRIYPEAKAYYNGTHFLTFIEGIMYDQQGSYNPRDSWSNSYRYVGEEELKQIIKSFRDVDSKFIEQGYGV